MATLPGERATVVGRPTVLYLPEVLWQDYMAISESSGLSVGQILSYFTFIGARAVADDARAAQFNERMLPPDTETTVEFDS